MLLNIHKFCIVPFANSTVCIKMIKLDAAFVTLYFVSEVVPETIPLRVRTDSMCSLEVTY
jgi:hypothetical protein